MAVILRYFSEFDSFRGALRKVHVRYLISWWVLVKYNSETCIKSCWFFTKLQTKITWLLVMADGVDLPSSSVSCGHFTCEIQKIHFSTILFMHTSDYLRHLRTKRTVSVIVNLSVTPEKCHRTTLWTHSSNGRYIVSLEKRASCIVSQPECQASVQSVHFLRGYMLPVNRNCIVHHALLTPCLNN